MVGVKNSQVLNIFKSIPEDVSTSKILENAFPEDFSRIEKALKSSIPETARKARSEKLILRRRVLYHLNKLVEKGVIRIHRVNDSGEKFFSLNLGDNEELVFDYKKRKINLSKPKIPLLPTEGYEKDKIMVKYRADKWLDAFNCILFSAEKFENITDLYDKILRSFEYVNDVIGVHSFEKIINSSSMEKLTKFYKHLSELSSDFGKNISIEIDLEKAENKEKLLDFIKMSLKCNDSIEIILSVDEKSMKTNKKFFVDMLSLGLNTGKRMYFRNKDLSEIPYIIGHSGPYTIDKNDWDSDAKGIVLGQTTLMIDTKKFSDKVGFSIEGFEDLITKTSKSIFSSNYIQRRNAYEYFGKLFDDMDEEKFLASSKNYIRFWNYVHLRHIYDEKMMTGIFNMMRKRLENFCKSQEVIYKSCGMPIRFKIAFSIADTDIYRDYFTTDIDKIKLIINNTNDLYGERLKEEIKSKESLFEIFDGGFQVNFHRKGIADADEMFREIKSIVGDFRLPFFSYRNLDMKNMKDIRSFL